MTRKDFIKKAPKIIIGSLLGFLGIAAVAQDKKKPKKVPKSQPVPKCYNNDDMKCPVKANPAICYWHLACTTPGSG